VPVLGPHEDLQALCEKHQVDEIIIASVGLPVHLRHILDHCRDVKARAQILPASAN